MAAIQRVVTHNKPGKASVLQVENRPVPQRGKGEALVKQYSTSVNPVDSKMRQRNSNGISKVAVAR